MDGRGPILVKKVYRVINKKRVAISETSITENNLNGLILELSSGKKYILKNWNMSKS
jgi:hypothetical protein